MKLEILLLRHGQTQGNLEKRYIGETDEPLLLDDMESMRKISALQKRLEQETDRRAAVSGAGAGCDRQTA